MVSPAFNAENLTSAFSVTAVTPCVMAPTAGSPGRVPPMTAGAKSATGPAIALLKVIELPVAAPVE